MAEGGRRRRLVDDAAQAQPGRRGQRGRCARSASRRSSPRCSRRWRQRARARRRRRGTPSGEPLSDAAAADRLGAPRWLRDVPRGPRGRRRSGCARTSTLTGGLLMAESVTIALAPRSGARRARARRQAAARAASGSDGRSRDGARGARRRSPAHLDAAAIARRSTRRLSRRRRRADRPRAGAPTATRSDRDEPVDVALTSSRARRTRRCSCSSTRSAPRRDVGRRRSAALAERFRVVRYDHARPRRARRCPPGPYSLDDLGGDALALLDRLGVERVALCGLSLGGMTGMWLARARARAHRAARPLLHVGAARPAGALARARGDRARAGDGGGRRRGARALVHARLPRGRARAVAPAAARCSRATPAEGYAGCCEAIARHGPARRARARITRADARDRRRARIRATPPEHGERIADADPGRAARRLLDAAHLRQRRAARRRHRADPATTSAGR